MASTASKILMQVLDAARYPRCDLPRCINGMACYVTRWTAVQDGELTTLMSYVMSSYDKKAVGWVGDPLDVIEPHLFADADLAGRPATERTTTLVEVQFKEKFPFS